jgi:hypothetical protein
MKPPLTVSISEAVSSVSSAVFIRLGFGILYDADTSAVIHSIGDSGKREKPRGEESDERAQVKCEWSKASSILTLLSYVK